MTSPLLAPPRRFVALAALAVLNLFPASSLWATPVKFDIPSQPMPAALQAFIKQSGTKVMFVEDEVQRVTANALSGEHEPSAGLDLLLKGTGFTSTERKAGWFAVIRQASEKPGSVEGSVRDEAGKPVAGARVAVADTDRIAVTDKRGRFAISGVPAGAHALHIMAEGMQNTRVTDVTVNAGRELSMSPITIPGRKEGTLELDTYTVSAKKNDGVLELDPYAVSGSKPKPFSTASIDLTRTENDVLPFQSYSIQDIEHSGATNLAEFFRLRLPQSFPRWIPEENALAGKLSPGSGYLTANALSMANGSGSQGLLGANELVILVNGRRLQNRSYGPPAESSVTSGDFRGIPLASIDRIEVLSSAGSAIYGSGATGGAINIITKQNYKGGAIAISYETPVDGHAPKYSFDFSYSIPVRAGTNLRASYSYSKSTPLAIGDRAELVARYRDFALQRHVGILLFPPNPPPLGATTNISALSGANLFGPGTSGRTSVPDGYAGGQGLTPFVGREGVFNLALAGGASWGNLYGLSSLVGPAVTNRSLLLGLDQAVGKSWRVTLEFSRQTGETTGKANPSYDGTAVLPASAPTNPFGQTVIVSIYDPRLDRQDFKKQLETTSDRVTASLRGEYQNWRFLFDLEHSRDKDDYLGIDFLPLVGDWATAYNLGLYNPLVDTRVVAPAAAAFYEEFRRVTNSQGGATRNYQATAKVSGPIYPLKSGNVEFTAGVEWLRSNRYRSYFRKHPQNSKSGALLPGSQTYDSPPSDINSYAIYAETTIPLVSSKSRVPLANRVELFGAGRISRQLMENFNITDVTNETAPDGLSRQVFVGETRQYSTTPYVYALGLRHDVIDGFGLRLSTSIGFRPPTFSQTIANAPATENLSVIDRRSNQTVSLLPTQVLTGGNPDLDPESTDSTNLGLIWEPRFINGLRLSGDYVVNARDTAITAVSPQLVLDLEASDSRIASRVRRDSSGNITSIDARNINFREIVSKVANVTIEQRIQNFFGGRFYLTASAAKNISFKVQTSATSPTVEQIRNSNAANIFFFGSRWNANGQIRWEGNRWMFGWSVRYFDSIIVHPRHRQLQGSDRVEYDLEHDGLVSYKFPRRNDASRLRGLISDVSLSLVMKNVFDRDPRFYAGDVVLGVAGPDSVYGRSLQLQVRKAF